MKRQNKKEFEQGLRRKQLIIWSYKNKNKQKQKTILIDSGEQNRS